MSTVQKIKMEEAKKVVGGYVVLWRQDTKTACKVESIDEEAKKVVYEIISGPDKGHRFMSKYDPSQTVELYDEGSVILAALNV